MYVDDAEFGSSPVAQAGIVGANDGTARSMADP